MKTLIKSGDFVRITNKELETDGIAFDSTVYVGATNAFPLTEEDGYTLRVKLFVHKLTDEGIDTTSGLFVIDPASVSEIPEWERQVFLDRFAPKDEPVKEE